MPATQLFNSEVVLKANFVDDEWEDAAGSDDGQKLVVHSSGQANSGGKNSVEVIVQYEAMTYEAPGGGPPLGGNQGFRLIAVLEQEVSSGVWVPVACQLQGVSRAVKGDQPTKHIITMAPGMPDANIRSNVQVGQESIDYHPVNGRAKASTDYRVCLVMQRTDGTRDQLASITFSAWLEFYDT